MRVDALTVDQNQFIRHKQILILNKIVTVVIIESKNRIKDEHKTMDERIGYSKSLGIKEEWLHQ